MPDPSLTNFGWNKFGGFNYIFESVFKGKTTVLWCYFLSIAPLWTSQWPQNRFTSTHWQFPMVQHPQGAQQSPHSLEKAIWDLLSSQACHDSLRCARVTRLSQQLQLFKMPWKCLLFAAWCMAESCTGSLPGGRHCCKDFQQNIPTCFLMALHFIPQLPDMFCCYLFLILNIKFVEEKN